MAGYIGKSQGVTQVDGYNRSEADTRYVNTAGDTMTGNLVTPMVVANSALSNRNLIINGAMQVAQRGTSSTAANYQTVDRWRNNFGGVSLTQSQEFLTSGDPFDAGFRGYLRLTQSASSSAATDFVQISQRIEGLNAATSGWNYKSPSSYLTASFWVRSSLAGTYYVYMQTRSDSGDGYINAPFTVSANTWTKVVISFAGNASLNIDNDNTSGIEFRIVPYYGTNFTSSSLPSNTWYFNVASGELPDFAQNWCGTSGATFDLTGVQLEAGDTATPFEHRSYGQELALCQRYYEEGLAQGTAAHSNSGYIVMRYVPRVDKRAASTVTMGDTYIENASPGTQANNTASWSSNGSGTGYPHAIATHYPAVSYYGGPAKGFVKITMDAEL